MHSPRDGGATVRLPGTEEECSGRLIVTEDLGVGGVGNRSQFHKKINIEINRGLAPAVNPTRRNAVWRGWAFRANFMYILVL